MPAMLELLGHLCRERILVKVAASAAGAAGTQLPMPPQQQVSGATRRLQALRGAFGRPAMSSAALPKSPYVQRRSASPATTGTKLSPNTVSRGAGLFNSLGNIGSATYGVFGR